MCKLAFLFKIYACFIYRGYLNVQHNIFLNKITDEFLVFFQLS